MTTAQYHKAEVDAETGWFVTPQEAYTEEEWDEYKHTCKICGDEFVLYFPDDTEARGHPAEYCSPECRQEAHRQQSREWARKQREGARR